MTLKEVLTVSGSLYKIPVVEVRKALKLAEDTDENTNIDAAVVLPFLEAQHGLFSKARFDKGATTREAALKSGLEKSIRKAYGIDEDLDFENTEALIKAVIEKQTAVEDDPANPGKKRKAGDPISEDEVKKHPLYLKLETAKNKEITDAKKAHTDEVTGLKKADEYKGVLAEIDTEIVKHFKEIGEAVLPENKEVADRQIRKMLNDEIKAGRKFQKNADGTFLVLNEDGTRAEDNLGHPVTVKDLVTTTAKSNFTFKVGVQRQTPAAGKSENKDQGATDKKKYTGKAPANSGEYVQLLSSPDLDTDEKTSIKEQYGANFSG